MEVVNSRSDLITVDNASVYDDLDETCTSSPYGIAGELQNESFDYGSQSFQPTTSISVQPRRLNRSPRAYSRCQHINGRTQDLRQKCQKLEKANRRLSFVFYILVTAVSLLVLLYLAFIVVILVALPKIRGDYPYCVTEKSIVDSGSKPLWDKLTDSIDTWEFTRTERCFADVAWMPKILNMMNDNLHEYTAKVENNQNHMENSLSNVGSLSANLYPDTSNGEPHNRSFNQRLVFAHLALDTDKPCVKEGDTYSLKWKDKSPLSSRQLIDLDENNGELRITQDGFYAVYSRVAFNKKPTASKLTHKVTRNYRNMAHGSKPFLMETTDVQASESFLQGTEFLREGDALAVLVSGNSLNTDRQHTTYFGVYLVYTNKMNNEQ